MRFTLDNLRNLSTAAPTVEAALPSESPPPPSFAEAVLSGPARSAEEDLRQLLTRGGAERDRREELFEELYIGRCFEEEIPLDPLVHPSLREHGLGSRRRALPPIPARLGLGAALVLAAAAALALVDALAEERGDGSPLPPAPPAERLAQAAPARAEAPRRPRPAPGSARRAAPTEAPLAPPELAGPEPCRPATVDRRARLGLRHEPTRPRPPSPRLPSPDGVSEEAPRFLTRFQVTRGLRAVEHGVRACVAGRPDREGRVVVDVAIDGATGRVRWTRVRAGAAAGELPCVTRAVGQARFPSFSSPTLRVHGFPLVTR